MPQLTTQALAERTARQLAEQLATGRRPLLARVRIENATVAGDQALELALTSGGLVLVRSGTEQLAVSAAPSQPLPVEAFGLSLRLHVKGTP